MATDSTIIFEGDPRMFLGADGSKLQFTGGQPVMDRGLENIVLIALFTSPDWLGNTLFVDPAQQIGSEFEIEALKPITITQIQVVRSAAIKALTLSIFGTIEVEVTNPNSHRLNVAIFIEPPGGDIQAFLLTKNGENWIFQATDPAHLRNGG